MGILMNVLYILLFILCLSVLIVIHELGHLTAAKIFKVYCLEFSIGFGPAIFKRRGKGKETQFSLRSIPFGGYVSMYGEGVELPEGQVIDNSRSLNGIKKWKRAIILVAGVFMNAVLAISLFFVAETCIPQNKYNPYMLQVESGSVMETIGFQSGDNIGYVDMLDNLFIIDDNATMTRSVIDMEGHENLETEQVFAVFNCYSLTFKNLSWDNYLEFYPVKYNEAEDGTTSPSISAGDVIAKTYYKYVDFKLSKFTGTYDSEDNPVFADIAVHYEKQPLGASFTKVKVRAESLGKAVKATFSDFGESATVIVRSLGSMLKPSEWKNMGGIIAVGFETTNTLTNLGLYYFVYLWGMISVNLAIINLLPFPGLDGWQLLVTIIEACGGKIPDKVKNIISMVGLVLLFGLMIVILFKDVFTYIFLGLL